MSPSHKNVFFYASVIAIFLIACTGLLAVKCIFIPFIGWGCIAIVLAVKNLACKHDMLKKRSVFYWVFGLCVWIIISGLWGINKVEQFLTGLGFSMSLIFAAFICKLLATLTAKQKHYLIKVLQISFWIMCAYVFFVVAYYQFYGLNIRLSGVQRVSIFLAAMAWPTFYAVQSLWSPCVSRRILQIMGIALIIFISFLGPMRSLLLAVAASGAVFCVVRIKPRSIYWLMGALLVVMCIGLPLLLIGENLQTLLDQLHDVLPTSWQHRIIIWYMETHMFTQKILFGWGAEATKYVDLSSFKDSYYIQYHGAEFYIRNNEFLPIHAHQGFLQILMELGLVGMALVAIIWWKGSSILLATRFKAAPYLAGTFFMLLVPFSLNYGLWQHSWITIWLMIFIAWHLVFLQEDSKVSH